MLFHVEGASKVAADLFDFWVEMPPHGLVTPKDYLAGGPRETPPELGVVAGLRRADLRLRGGDRREPRPPLRPRARGPGDRRGDAVLGQYRPPPPRRPPRLRRKPAALREVAARARRAPARRAPTARNSSSTPGTNGPRRPCSNHRSNTAGPTSTRSPRSAPNPTDAPMSRIVLHVGTHKTATTTVQDTLALNRRHLAGHGIVFPQVGPNAGQHALVTRLDPAAGAVLRQPAGAGKPGSTLARGHAAGDATVIVSSEEFSRAARGSTCASSPASSLPSTGGPSSACCATSSPTCSRSICRSPRRPGVAGFEAFLAEALRTGLATGLQLDYGALYDRLLAGFAPEEIVFLCYEAAVRGPGGIIGGLLRPARAWSRRRWAPAAGGGRLQRLASAARRLGGEPRSRRRESPGRGWSDWRAR